MIKLRVREVAEAQGIESSAGLEGFLGIAHSVADRLWKGKPIPRLEKLAGYADKLGVPLEALYERNGTTPTANKGAKAKKRR